MTRHTYEISEAVDQVAAAYGLRSLGGFHPRALDNVPKVCVDRQAATLVLLGNAGPDMWEVFEANRPAGPNPLDRWTVRVVNDIAEAVGANGAVFPFEGPPFYPFQRWAMRTKNVHASPLGILIHPEYGLWHAYRGVLLFKDKLPLTTVYSNSPCTACVDKPCLAACPANAVNLAGFDFPACQAYLADTSSSACRRNGCQARYACPVGRHYAYSSTQAKYHLYFETTDL